MSDDIAFDAYPLIRFYKDGRVERFFERIPAGDESITGVKSKDIIISPSVSVRLYKPETTACKLPLVIYIHGGGFVTESNSSVMYHSYINSLVKRSDVVVVSVEYKLAPEHPLPAAYEDSWEAIKWVATHVKESGPDPWLNEYADFRKVVFAGDSAGANIAHHMAIRIGLNPIEFKLTGLALVHAYFGGVEPLAGEDVGKKFIADKLWALAKPNTSGSDDPDFNPEKDPRVSKIVCDRILICVADKDLLKYRGWQYSNMMKKCGWKGIIEVFEDEEVDHCFHLLDPTNEKSLVMMNRFTDFIRAL